MSLFIRVETFHGPSNNPYRAVEPTTNMTNDSQLLRWNILPLLCHGHLVELNKSLTCIAVLETVEGDHRCMRTIGTKSKDRARELAYGGDSTQGLNAYPPGNITEESLNELLDVLLCSGSCGHRANPVIRKQTLKRCQELLKVKIERLKGGGQLTQAPRSV